ncbi:MAG: hypothetical protein Ct9H90mP17_3540 [Actinomycetota bacterium]|nr:MAG: hypothetical protein Ct9H90mP17_3540 [Actinomycetota bacterium]
MVGFLTNIVSPLTQLKDFGITTALGIFYAFILVMTLVPAIRTFLIRDQKGKHNRSRCICFIWRKTFNKLSKATSIIPKRLKIIAVALILGIGGYGYYSFTNISTCSILQISYLQIVQR